MKRTTYKRIALAIISYGIALLVVSDFLREELTFAGYLGIGAGVASVSLIIDWLGKRDHRKRQSNT